MAAKIRRQYAGAAAQTSITSAITAGDTSVSVASTTGWPSTASVPFYVVIDPDTSVEEKCSVTISGSTLTLTRGVDGTVAAAHASGATIYPVFTATDADEANELASKFTAKGDLVAQGSSTFTTVTVGANGTFLKADSGASAGVSWDAIDLGTDTTGNYVATIAGTSNQVTVSGSGSESAAVTLSTPQDIHTGATPTFAGAILSGSSSGDLLRITQTGAGNALLVEDSTNPDATPFVISASGQMFKGHTESSGSTLSNVTPASQFSGTTTDTSSLGLYNFVAGSAGPSIRIFKSRSGTVGNTAVQSGDTLAFIEGLGADGTNFIPAASILVSADGSPATNSVPGRIVFATNSGGTTTTERMRIDSAGQVGIGATPTAGRNLIVGKTITGSTTSIAVLSSGTIQSDVTSEVASFRSNINTAAASFTLTALSHYQVVPTATAGSGSTITSQFGFNVASTMTGATNNYGFYGDIAAATGRYNLYMSGTADNYMLGRLGVGALAGSSTSLSVGKNVTGAVTGYGVLSNGVIQSDVTTAAYGFASSPTTQAASFTVATLSHFAAIALGLGASSAVTTQIGFRVQGGMTGATNNYGFLGGLAAASGSFNLYMQGTADNYLAGRLGVGATLTSGAMAQVTNTTAADKAFVVKGAASQTGALLEIQDSAGTALTTVSSTGLISGSGPSLGAWTSYTPTWGGNTTNPTIGNGTLTGSYCQIGKMVFARVKIVAGSTTTFGSGAYYISMPVTAKTSDQCIGHGFLVDASAGTRYLVLLTPASTTNLWIRYSDTPVDTNATTPMTWASSDSLTVSFMYEAA